MKERERKCKFGIKTAIQVFLNRLFRLDVSQCEHVQHISLQCMTCGLATTSVRRPKIGRAKT